VSAVRSLTWRFTNRADDSAQEAASLLRDATLDDDEDEGTNHRRRVGLLHEAQAMLEVAQLQVRAALAAAGEPPGLPRWRKCAGCGADHKHATGCPLCGGTKEITR